MPNRDDNLILMLADFLHFGQFDAFKVYAEYASAHDIAVATRLAA